MSTIIQGDELRTLLLGRTASKSITLAGAATHQVFTVTVGDVLITALWGKCTTTMAGTNTVQLQMDPTTGDTTTWTQADDLGSTNTEAGTLLMFQIDVDDTVNTPHVVKGAGNVLAGVAAPIGDVECVVTGAGADGVIAWYCTWIPLSDGAVLTAAA
jgi:hypothetical protein